MIDLHSHSAASDGSLQPSELLRLGVSEGLSALAITDHDCVDGLPEAIETAKELDIEFVPGIELSASLAGGTLHIVGLFIDHTEKAIVEPLLKVRNMRNQRNPLIVRRLEELGVHITLEEVSDIAGGTIVGRPHFARILVEKGYARNPNDAFSRYIGNGASADVPKERLSPAECIRTILDAGGVPILAHPDQTQRKGKHLESLIGELKEYGLMGIEVFTASYRQDRITMYSDLATRYELLRSGGSDFHGASKKDIRLGKGLGRMYIHPDILPPIRRAAASLR